MAMVVVVVVLVWSVYTCYYYLKYTYIDIYICKKIELSQKPPQQQQQQQQPHGTGIGGQESSSTKDKRAGLGKATDHRKPRCKCAKKSESIANLRESIVIAGSTPRFAVSQSTG